MSISFLIYSFNSLFIYLNTFYLFLGNPIQNYTASSEIIAKIVIEKKIIDDGLQ